MFDGHIHIGQFYNFYNSSQRLFRFMHKMNISGVAVSSTTTCVNPCKALREIVKLTERDPKSIFPVLWITKWMLDTDYINEYLKTDIDWRCIKVHGQLEPGVWLSDTGEMKQVVSLARLMNLPILFHTCHKSYSSSITYYDVIKNNPDLTFILAHGRPLFSALKILENLSNTYVDTAFMPIADINDLIKSGFSNRIIWGSDCLVNRYFKGDECQFTLKYYGKRLHELRMITTQSQRVDILRNNFLRVFNK